MFFLEIIFRQWIFLQRIQSCVYFPNLTTRHIKIIFSKNWVGIYRIRGKNFRIFFILGLIMKSNARIFIGSVGDSNVWLTWFLVDFGPNGVAHPQVSHGYQFFVTNVLWWYKLTGTFPTTNITSLTLICVISLLAQSTAISRKYFCIIVLSINIEKYS